MSFRRHKEVIGNFNKEYVRAEIFPRQLGRRSGQAEEIRHASDYDDFYIASKEEAARQIETAKLLIQLVEDYCVCEIERSKNGNNTTVNSTNARNLNSFSDEPK